MEGPKEEEDSPRGCRTPNMGRYIFLSIDGVWDPRVHGRGKDSGAHQGTCGRNNERDKMDSLYFTAGPRYFIAAPIIKDRATRMMVCVRNNKARNRV